MTTTTADNETSEAASTPTRRTRRRTQSSTLSATAARGRRPRLSGDALVNSLAEMVDRLIKENRDLKRALARAEATGGGAALGQSVKTLSGLQRRLNRALAETPTTRRRRTTAAAESPRPRRKVTDPEVLERRRQALAKARAARQAKREAGG